MKTYLDYYNEWVFSTESRDLSFEEWLMWQLDRQKEQMIDKALEIYEKELRQMKRILNEVKDGTGELISIDGSLTQFRKAMKE